VTTPDEVYKALKPEDFIGSKESVTVVDFWRCLSEPVRLHSKIRYVPMGRCLDDGEAIRKIEKLWRHGNM
jgi:hypothetical protein